jgi:Eco57I restriction-modification methylase
VHAVYHEVRYQFQRRLEELNAELNRYLATEYDLEPDDERALADWLETHRPFHWLVECYEIIESGGFDVIVGNPPWKEYSAVKRHYTVRGYTTEKSGNLYAMCVERSLGICADDGQLSFIVQLPLMSSRRMTITRELLRERSGALTLVPFDDRPGKLFEGLQHCRSVIFKARVGSNREPSPLLTSKYQRWPTVARSSLFARLELTEVTKETIYPQRFAKFANRLQSSIFVKAKSSSDRTVASALTPNRNDRFIFYQEAMQYWVKAAIGLPDYARDGKVGAPPHGRYLSFQNPGHAKATYALLNSSLFYCYFVTYGDGFHLSQELVSQFPVPSALLDDDDLSTLGGWLMEDLNDNAGKETIRTRDGHTITYAEFYGWMSKHIIDEIDRVLAEHYGFTDEELDFIVNYDIKYRMGAEAAG